MVHMRIIETDDFRVCGVSTFITGQHNEEFGDFWDKCNSTGISGKIKNLSNDPESNTTHSNIMGVSRVEKDPNNRAFDFYICCECDSSDEFESFTVKGGTWAVFNSDGDTPFALIEAEMEAFMKWLPSSEYEHDNRPEIEVYPQGTGVYVEFWLPIRKK